MAGSGNGVATAAMLTRAAEVLQTCATSITELEDLFHHSGDSVNDSSQRVALQKFDYLGQSLIDLSICLTELAEAQRSNAPVDALTILTPLRLHDLRLYLAGQTEMPEAQVNPGHFALF